MRTPVGVLAILVAVCGFRDSGLLSQDAVAPISATLRAEPLPAGDAPPFLAVSVQPIRAPAEWRSIYREVERCAGLAGNYDSVRWAVMPAPMQGPKGPTYAFTVNQRIVLVQGDTTYLRHEMLHHILEVAGWHPRPLQTGERYTIADLHPMPLFGRCIRGR